jgi:DNA primase
VKDGVKRVFARSRFLYNGHRLAKPLKHLVLVEGFSSVWWMHQHGIPQVVAIMGSDSSDEQARLIGELVSDDGVVYVMTDGDAAGVRGAEKFIPLVSRVRAVRYVRLDDGRQPTDLSADELKMFFPFAP